MQQEPFGRRFGTTRWSIVLAAGGPATPDSRNATAALFEQYWYPLYAYLRRAGHEASDAEDLVQGFLLRLLEKDGLQSADPQRGRFRSFLLVALKHFVINEWERRRAQKRGGEQTAVSLDLRSGEERFRREPQDESTPETVYERQWALTTLERALERLRAECQAAGKEGLFEHLRPYLSSSAEAPRHADTAAATGMTEGAVKVAVHRLRRRCGDLLREEIAGTVSSREELQEEVDYLIAAAGR